MEILPVSSLNSTADNTENVIVAGADNDLLCLTKLGIVLGEVVCYYIKEKEHGIELSMSSSMKRKFMKRVTSKLPILFF
nr:hypothetical protein [Tanacetum cinerariifolium]